MKKKRFKKKNSHLILVQHQTGDKVRAKVPHYIFEGKVLFWRVGLYIYNWILYIYIYVCVCVCVCVSKKLH